MGGKGLCVERSWGHEFIDGSLLSVCLGLEKRSVVSDVSALWLPVTFFGLLGFMAIGVGGRKRKGCLGEIDAEWGNAGSDIVTEPHCDPMT